MRTVLIQYTLTEEVYRNLLFMCSKRGYKIKSIDRTNGLILAEKKTFFTPKTNLDLFITSKEKDIVRIEIIVTQKNKSDLKEEEIIRTTIFKYF